MTQRFSELHERLEVVCQEIEDLKTKLNDWGTESIELWGKIASNNPSDPRSDLFLIQKHPVSVALRVKVGMIANEIRAVLDGLAIELADRGRGAKRETSFPICRSEEIFRSSQTQQKIKSLTQADQAKIAELMPWKGADNLLYALHEVDRMRKHIRLGGCGAENFEFELFDGTRHGRPGRHEVRIGDGPSWWFDLNRLTGAEVGVRVQIAGNVPMKYSFRIRTGVSFTEPVEVRGKEVPAALLGFVAEVRRALASFS